MPRAESPAAAAAAALAAVLGSVATPTPAAGGIDVDQIVHEMLVEPGWSPRAAVLARSSSGSTSDVAAATSSVEDHVRTVLTGVYEDRLAAALCTLDVDVLVAAIADLERVRQSRPKTPPHARAPRLSQLTRSRRTRRFAPASRPRMRLCLRDRSRRLRL